MNTVAISSSNFVWCLFGAFWLGVVIGMVFMLLLAKDAIKRAHDRAIKAMFGDTGAANG